MPAPSEPAGLEWLLGRWAACSPPCSAAHSLRPRCRHNSRVGCELAGAILILIVNMCQIIYYGLTEDGTEPLQCGRRANPVRCVVFESTQPFLHSNPAMTCTS